jgi:VanZ family protein
LYSYLEKHHKYLINLPLIIYWIILFVLTTLPGNEALNIGVNDKIEHFGAYGVLSAILYLNLLFQEKYPLYKKYPATFTLVVASLYGMVDELHQIFVPGRTADIRDWLADFLGSVLGVLIIKFILIKLKQIEGNKVL